MLTKRRALQALTTVLRDQDDELGRLLAFLQRMPLEQLEFLPVESSEATIRSYLASGARSIIQIFRRTALVMCIILYGRHGICLAVHCVLDGRTHEPRSVLVILSAWASTEESDPIRPAESDDMANGTALEKRRKWKNVLVENWVSSPSAWSFWSIGPNFWCADERY